MTCRHHAAVASQELPCTLHELITNLYHASTECEAIGVNPQTDPAVVLLTYQIAFQANADMVDRQRLDSLLTHCKQERGKKGHRWHVAH